MEPRTRAYAFIFDEPRLRMTSVGRLIVRFASIASYTLLIATALILLLADLPGLRATGGILTLFLAHRALRMGRADRSIARLPRAGAINVARYLTPRSYRLIESAFGRARFTSTDFALNLLARLLERPEVKRAFLHLDVDPKTLQGEAEAALKAGAQKLERGALAETVTKLAVRAFHEARALRDPAVEPRHLLAVLEELESPAIAKLWNLLDLTPRDVALAAVMSAERRRRGGFLARPYRMRHRVMNRAWTARPTKTLDRLSDDLTDLSRATGAGAVLFGHREEYEQMLDVLARPGNQNVLLVGEPGAGKTAILQHLAYEMVHDRVPKPLFDRRLVALEVGALVSGAPEEELTRRMKKVLDEILAARNVLLVIPDIHNLARTSGERLVNAADIILPLVKGDVISVIGTTYPRELKEYIELNSEFSSSFEAVRVEEISEEEATRFLIMQSVTLEAEFKLVVSFRAIKAAVELAHKFFRQTLLPGSAEDLLKEAAAETTRKGEQAITADEVRAVAERRIKIPLHATKAEEKEKLLNLEMYLHERFIDQDDAVKAIAKALREYRSGLARKGGPIASFLFVGPTGVGKTQLAKLLAEVQFGSQSLMIRFDMSEYQTKESLYRFIGSPDGKLRGALTEAVLEHPYALVLLDEFEKANPDILNLFLQVFDDGRLTDSLQRTINFENTILIATSNAHSDILMDALRKGESVPKIAEYLKTKLVDFFKPELLNRFTDIIVFRDLGVADLKQIVRLELKELEKTLADQGIGIRFDETVIEQLAKWGYDPQFGARPLRRTIDEKIKSPLADKILRGDLTRGSAVRVALENEQIQFR